MPCLLVLNGTQVQHLLNASERTERSLIGTLSAGNWPSLRERQLALPCSVIKQQLAVNVVVAPLSSIRMSYPCTLESGISDPTEQQLGILVSSVLLTFLKCVVAFGGLQCQLLTELAFSQDSDEHLLNGSTSHPLREIL